jgi:hypothetical protein
MLTGAADETFSPTTSPQVADVLVRYAATAPFIEAGITQSLVPGFAFSTAVVGQLDGHPTRTAGIASTGTSGIGAGGAISARVAVPDMSEVADAEADIANVRMPPYFDSTNP